MRTFTTAALAAAGAVLALASVSPVPATALAAPAVISVEGTCHDAQGSWPCTVDIDIQTSKKQYGRATMEGEAYLNCTRNRLDHNRPVHIATPGRADFATGDGGGAVRRPASFTWTKDTYEDFPERIEPGEVSWVEAQRATESGNAKFTVRDEKGHEQTLAGTFDGPATGLSDRLFQRTGPMTAGEQQRCRSDRPTAQAPRGADAR
ncbi:MULTISPECIES: hypothetical protein [Streptomyces]|uniref:hypothetical protein n=1 Tax=Streptomyces TaxID=1883 RepID=UPI002DD8F03C|nr:MULTISPECIES: hypothetical protein [unclassified Streptomyces]WSE01204.1 hypothetical protein OG758_48165 [Streptomyces sp. NBC_01474]